MANLSSLLGPTYRSWSSGDLSIGTSTPSTSTTTGALVVSGGVGIGGNLYVGGSFNIPTLALSGTTASTSTTTGALTVVGGVGIGGNINAGGIVIANNYDVGLTTAASDSIALDFSAGTGLTTRAVAGNVTFTASNYRAGAIKTVRLVNGATQRTLTFPASWVWMGSAPTVIAASKTGILSVTSFGTTEANCVATWTVQL